VTRVAIKYCGCCSPWVDLAKVGHEVERQLRAMGALLCSPDCDDLDCIAILNGCPRVCADRPDVWQRAKKRVVLSGIMISEAAADAQNEASLAGQILSAFTCL
jgi:hypothetical protein